MSEANGAALPAGEAEAAKAAAQMTPQQAQSVLKQLVEQQVATGAAIFVNGVITSAGGAPGNLVLPAIARQVAKMCAVALCGVNDVAQTIRGREDLRKAFEEGLRMVPAIQAPGAAIKPQG